MGNIFPENGFWVLLGQGSKEIEPHKSFSIEVQNYFFLFFSSFHELFSSILTILIHIYINCMC